MQVNPVSSISYRVVRPKRAFMGETESERQRHSSFHQNRREAARNEFEAVTGQPAPANAATSFYAQLSAQNQLNGGTAYERDLAFRTAHAHYRAATSSAPAATIGLTV